MTASARGIGEPPYAVVLTCEHGGNVVPAEYRKIFRGARGRAALDTHRGYDLGALSVARTLGRRLGVRVIAATVTRLLVDLNRSVGHPRLWSEFSFGLGPAERERTLAKHYVPYRQGVEEEVSGHISAGRSVLHLSVHSFTPKLNGRVRTAEVGLLYDPVRKAERKLCERWKGMLEIEARREASSGNRQSDWRIRRNYPYRGTSDGLTKSLREVLPAAQYLGIELEVNQALLADEGSRRGAAQLLGESLEAALSSG